MIIASHFKDRPKFASFECSDGKVFEVDYEKVYNDALTHEYRCCKEQLAKYVDVTYNAMKDPVYNKDDQYTSLDNFMNDHIDYGDSMILYVMKPKVGADHDAVFKACRAWYDYLIVTQEANHMYDIATSIGKMAECENIHIPNLQLKSDDAYVIKATRNIDYGTITLQLTTLQVELKLKHAEVVGIKKEYDDYEHLNELTKDVGLD